MIRLRDIKGNIIPTPEKTTFIELCSSDGKIGFVHYCPDDTSMSVITKTSSEAQLYSNRFDVEFVDKVIDLEDRYKDV